MTNNKTPSAKELAALFRRKMAEVGSAFDCLQAESAEKDKEIRRMSDNCTKVVNDAEIWKQKHNSVLAELARVTAERDAAVESWRGFCSKCAWNGKQRLSDGQLDARCKTCRENAKCNWEWRGAQKEGGEHD